IYPACTRSFYHYTYTQCNDDQHTCSSVGVGMPVTQHPLHRSVRAGLPHTAPALGRDDQTLVRVRVAYAWGWQPVSNDLVHALPAQVLGLAAAAQCAMPQPTHLEAEGLNTCSVAGHGEVAGMPGHYRAQVLALLGDGPVHAFAQLRLDGQQLGARAFAAGDSQHHELALPGFAAAMREAQEVEGVRF